MGAVKHVKKPLRVLFKRCFGLLESVYTLDQLAISVRVCLVLDSSEVCEIIKNCPLNYLVNWICFTSSGTGS